MRAVCLVKRVGELFKVSQEELKLPALEAVGILNSSTRGEDAVKRQIDEATQRHFIFL